MQKGINTFDRSHAKSLFLVLFIRTASDHHRFDGNFAGGGLITRNRDGMRCFLLKPTRNGAGDELLMGECAAGLALVFFSGATLVSADGCFSGDGVGMTVALFCFACVLSAVEVSVGFSAGALSSFS